MSRAASSRRGSIITLLAGKTYALSHRAISDADVHRLWARLVPWPDANASDDAKIAKRAVELAPIDPLVLDVYAAYLADQGHHADALIMQQRAVALLPEDARVPQLFEHLRVYEARARTP